MQILKEENAMLKEMAFCIYAATAIGLFGAEIQNIDVLCPPRPETAATLVEPDALSAERMPAGPRYEGKLPIREMQVRDGAIASVSGDICRIPT